MAEGQLPARRVPAADLQAFIQRALEKVGIPVFGLLAGTLSGAAMGRDVVDFNKDDNTPTNTGHAIVAIGVEPMRGSMQGFAKCLVAEIEKWGEFVRKSSAKID